MLGGPRNVFKGVSVANFRGPLQRVSGGLAECVFRGISIKDFQEMVVEASGIPATKKL